MTKACKLECWCLVRAAASSRACRPLNSHMCSMCPCMYRCMYIYAYVPMCSMRRGLRNLRCRSPPVTSTMHAHMHHMHTYITCTHTSHAHIPVRNYITRRCRTLPKMARFNTIYIHTRVATYTAAERGGAVLCLQRHDALPRDVVTALLGQLQAAAV
jgi:hypothetical protein